jgi:hypothetical protein
VGVRGVCVQAQVIWLRFSAYVGVTLNGLLVPLVLYQITGSTSAAGLAVFAEWAPRIVLSVYGGHLAARLRSKHVHLALEIGRVVALVLLLLAVLRVVAWPVIAVAAALYQCTNALSNILFEALVSANWSQTTRSQGHASIGQADMEAAMLASLAGWLLLKPQWVLGMALGLQVLVVGLVALWRHRIHAALDTTRSSQALGIADIWKAWGAAGPRFKRIALLSAMTGLPLAAFLSALPFVLHAAFPRASMNLHTMALMTGVRLVLAVVVLRWVGRVLKTRAHIPRWLVVGAYGALFVGATFVLTNAAWLVVTGVCLVAAGQVMAMPWLRTTRQALMPQDPAGRLGLTGFVVMADSSSYLCAALGIYASEGSMRALAGFCWLALAVAVASWLLSTRRQPLASTSLT